MRVVPAPNYYDPRDAIGQDMVRWIESLQMAPILIPNVLNSVEDFLDEMALDAIVLGGGNNLVPQRDGDPDVSDQRTKSEYALIDFAVEHAIPLAGICRGLHVINQRFGGRVTPVISHASVQHVASEHDVLLDQSCALLAGSTSISTNSFHNQGVAKSDVATGFHVFAEASGDCLVEGIRHQSRRIVAVQWHPERPSPSAAFDDRLFRLFFDLGVPSCK